MQLSAGKSGFNPQCKEKKNGKEGKEKARTSKAPLLGLAIDLKASASFPELQIMVRGRQVWPCSSTSPWSEYLSPFVLDTWPC